MVYERASQHRPCHRVSRRRLSACRRVRTASAQEAEAPPRQHWSFSGPFGMYDPAQLQRGFKIYREVCSTCHSLKLLAFRNLADPGGPGFTEAQAAAIAAGYKVTDGPNDKGEMFQRPGKLADHFPPPFPNDQAARAAIGGGAAAGHVGAGQGARLRARLSLVHLRCFHPIPGGRAGLHPRHPQRLRRSRRPGSRCRRARNTTNIFPATPSACRSR